MREPGESKSGVGIARHLFQVLEDLRYIRENIQDVEKKKEYFDLIHIQLNFDEKKLKEETEDLDEEIPDELRDFMCELDTAMKTSKTLFLDSMNKMLKFIESEDPELLEESAKATEEGENMQNRASELNQILKDYLEQQVLQGAKQED